MKKYIDKAKSLPAGVKASFAFFGASVITSGLAYITAPIYTRLLSPDEYGQISVFFTWLNLLGIVAMFCLSAGVFNNGMSDYPEDRDSYSFSILILSNIITLVFAVILFSAYPFIKEIISLDFPLLALMILVYLTMPANSFWLSRQRYEYKYKASVIYTVATALFSSLVAIVSIIIVKEGKVYARIFGAELTLISFYVFLYFYLAKKSKFKVKTAYWKQAFLFNLPLIPHYLSTYLLSGSDKIMISRLIGDSAAAYYSIASSVASVGTIVWSAANSSLIPYTYEKCKKKDYSAISRVTLPILILFSVACFFIILLAPEVVAIMATKDYKEAIYAIPPIVGGVFFQVQYFLYANILYYHKKPKYVMYASVISAALNILLNYIFIPKYGYIAAGYTTLFCYLLQATLDFLLMRSYVGQSVYNMKHIGILSAIIIALSILSPHIYAFRLLRYFAVLLSIVVAILMRDRIKNILTIIKKEDNKNEA